MNRAEGLQAGLHRRFHRGFVRHIGGNKQRFVAAQLLSQGLTEGFVHIQNGDLATRCHNRLYRRFTQTRCTAGDQSNFSVYIHLSTPKRDE